MLCALQRLRSVPPLLAWTEPITRMLETIDNRTLQARTVLYTIIYNCILFEVNISCGYAITIFPAIRYSDTRLMLPACHLYWTCFVSNYLSHWHKSSKIRVRTLELSWYTVVEETFHCYVDTAAQQLNPRKISWICSHFFTPQKFSNALKVKQVRHGRLRLCRYLGCFLHVLVDDDRWCYSSWIVRSRLPCSVRMSQNDTETVGCFWSNGIQALHVPEKTLRDDYPFFEFFVLLVSWICNDCHRERHCRQHLKNIGLVQKIEGPTRYVEYAHDEFSPA